MIRVPVASGTKSTGTVVIRPHPTIGQTSHQGRRVANGPGSGVKSLAKSQASETDIAHDPAPDLQPQPAQP